MNCPWCPLSLQLGELHGHLADAHGELVTLARSATGTHTYEVRCPICGARYDRRIKPRVADEAFLAEFDREIRLVALDMLVCHLAAEHMADQDAPDPAGVGESGG